MPDLAIVRIDADDANATHSRYGRWKYTIPLPPDSLMWSVGGTNIENFLVVGDAWAQVISRYTRPECTVLDIGSGCGRTARILSNNRWISNYVGFDVVSESVQWCKRFVKPAFAGHCDFFHFDLYSAEYNPEASLRASDLRFPCDDATVHVSFAASVFTHLLEPDARHYLAELARVLVPGGIAVLSIHSEVPSGYRFYGSETRIDIEVNYFLEMCAEAGLREIDRIPDLAGQLACIVTR